MLIDNEIQIYKNRISNGNINSNTLLNKYIYKSLYKDNLEEIADNMLKNIYYLPNIGQVKDLFDKGYNRSLLRLTHGFTMIWPLSFMYKKTNDKKYLLKEIEIVEEWIKNWSDKSNTMAFHDETTSLRMIHLIYIFNECIDVIDVEYLRTLFIEINNTADLLASEQFYTKNTNHGMFQDRSLILFCIYFNEYYKSKEYFQLAKYRIKSYVKYIYTTSGIHKEHSPAYHFIVSRRVLEIAKDIEPYDFEFYEYIYNLYLKTCEYATYIIKPDGKLPNIGDTEPNIDARLNYKNMYNDKNYQNHINKKYDDITLSTNYVDIESGYAILRDKWSEDSIYILYTACYHTSYHKHCDDLNFIIYHKGDIITESGPYGYNYDNELCKYGYSNFAHNTLIVNDESLPRIDGKYEKVKLTNYKQNDKKIEVVGINERYENTKHERTLIFDKESLEIEICDHIWSDSNKDYTFLFHLAPDIVPIIKDNEVDLYKNENLICKLIFDSKEEFNITDIFGDAGEKIKGINFPSMYNTSLNYTIKVNLKQSEILLNTKIIMI